MTLSLCFGSCSWVVGHTKNGDGSVLIQTSLHTVKPVLVATSIKQATCIKQVCIHFMKKSNTLKLTYIKQAPVLSKHILIILLVLA